MGTKKAAVKKPAPVESAPTSPAVTVEDLHAAIDEIGKLKTRVVYLEQRVAELERRAPADPAPTVNRKFSSQIPLN